jgi:hypothetical protein
MAQKILMTAASMNKTGEWWFGSRENRGFKLTKSSDGVDREGKSSSGNPQSVDDGKYYSGKGSYWTCSGEPWGSSGMTCGTVQNVGDHYWSSYVFGVDARQEWGRLSDTKHSPVYSYLINRISFDWTKVDGSTRSNAHHIRGAALGLIHRTGTSSFAVKSWPCPTSERLHKFESSTNSGHSVSGSYNKTCSGQHVKYPVGFFLCIEWQGNSNGTASSGVPKIIIKNLRLGTNAGSGLDPLMTKYDNYSSFSQPDPLPLWTI